MGFELKLQVQGCRVFFGWIVESIAKTCKPALFNQDW